MATTFDQKTGASIPALETAFRGSVANYAKSAWYWPPIKNRAERVENHLFKTDSTVLDIRGGTELANSGLNAPGEMLIFDAKGRLSVVNELDDRSDFRSYFVPEPEVTRPGETETTRNVLDGEMVDEVTKLEAVNVAAHVMADVAKAQVASNGAPRRRITFVPKVF